ncbi:hypothetical protein [Dyadobacter frigoris]|uniref:DUF2306 domain-containing protein n=1 Tax=Dyadobacter frigoris TaxID=2576211 RepID=A0A4V6BJ40_9BACT|nr:hypothetical protein [Dyadobacter frigoris]TKT90513.1 hypothetical protein FDK13_19460 [Dyadobacter frigoris]GLU51354.1 hypothetical protein Dfri01_08150 [Dyadobacter frigoris]
MEKLHLANLTLHVIAGSTALLTGFAAVFAKKGLGKHVLFGKYFMWMIVVVIITGLFGVIVFNRNSFLLVITLLSGYNCFSGIRSLKLRGQKPETFDYVIPLLVMISAVYYLYYLNSNGLYWSPVIIYSTLGALFLVSGYDLCKWFIPVHFLEKAIMYEHAYKMISALSAISSAFSGTVFPDYKPYSQFLPSVAGMIYIIITFILLSKKSFIFKTKTIVRHTNQDASRA